MQMLAAFLADRFRRIIAAAGNDQRRLRHLRAQFGDALFMQGKGLPVAPVNGDDGGINGRCLGQLRLRVNIDNGRHVQLLRQLQHFAQVTFTEYGRYQPHRIRPCHRRFIHLVRIENEVMPNDRYFAR